MITLSLQKNHVAHIDDEDLHKVLNYKWTACNCRGKWTARRFINKKTIYMHQEILETKSPVSHIDGNGLNNQKANLLVSNASALQQGRYKRAGTSSKYIGVYWRRDLMKWHARIYIAKKYLHIGFFGSDVEAARAYNDKALRFFGASARLNDI